jgi:hypothetical protein
MREHRKRRKAAEGRRTPGRFALAGPPAYVPASWTAPTEHSVDGAFVRVTRVRTTQSLGSFESGVAIRFPPQSKTLGYLPRGSCLATLLRATDPRSDRNLKTRHKVQSFTAGEG